jgi:hypothetical protein
MAKKIHDNMDINVIVTIGLAKHVQDLVESILRSATQQPVAQEQRTNNNNGGFEKVAEEAPQEVEPTEEQPSASIEVGPEDVVSIDTVRDRVSELVRAGKRAKVVEILGTYGATGYSQLASNELNEFYAKIKKL